MVDYTRELPSSQRIRLQIAERRREIELLQRLLKVAELRDRYRSAPPVGAEDEIGGEDG